MLRVTRSSKRATGAFAMGNTPSQTEDRDDAEHSPTPDAKAQGSKSTGRVLATRESNLNKSPSVQPLSSPGDRHSSKSEKKKKKKKRKKKQIAQNMTSESTKEEESARTLLEMKGAPAKPEFAPSEPSSSSIPRATNSGQFRAVNRDIEEPRTLSHGRLDDAEYRQLNNETAYGLSRNPNHSNTSTQLIDSPPLTPGLRQQSIPTDTRDEDLYEPPHSHLHSQAPKDYGQTSYQEASNVPTPPYGSNLDSPVQASYPTSIPAYITPGDAHDVPRSVQHEQQNKNRNIKPRKEKNNKTTDVADPTTMAIDPILTGYDRGREDLSIVNNQADFPSPSVPPIYTTKRKRDSRDIIDNNSPETIQKRPKVSNDVESAKKKAQPGGVFTDEEITLLKNFMERYREEHGITEQALNDRIQETSRSNRDQFWTEVTDVLPYRTRQSIYKVCRRRFHNFGVRGKWTPEEDEELKAAQLEKPNQWKAIGAMVHRMPEDCRDRWRNYLKCGDARNHDVWKADEERALEKAVNECKEAMRAERAELRRLGKLGHDDTVVEDEDKLLNWTIISEKMGGVRSRLQCQYKWPKMKKRNEEQLRQNLEKQRRIAMGLDPLEQPKRTWRVKRAEGNYTKMLPGDKYELLAALEESGAYDEKNIPWKIVGSEGFRKRWSTPDRRTAFRFLKDQVPNNNSLTLQEIISSLKQEILEKFPNRLNEFYDFSKDNAQSAQKRKRRLSEKTHDEDEDNNTHDSSEISFEGNEYVNAKNTAVLAQSLLEPQVSRAGQYNGNVTTYGNNVDEEMARRVELLQDA